MTDISDTHRAGTATSMEEFATSIEEEYDYIVVGSGAGGGPVAANLAKNRFRVLVLEAGGVEEPIEYRVPAFHAFSTEHNDLAWKFYVQHYNNDAQRRRDVRNFLIDAIVDGAPRNGIFYPRAGTLGGCTAHHAMIFLCPHNSDWEQIAKTTGDCSWKASRMRRYFERIERCEYVRRPWCRWFNFARHGFDGWLSTSIADPTLLLRDPVLARLVVAAAQTCFDSDVGSLEGLLRRLLTWLQIFLDPFKSLLQRIWAWLESFLDPNDWRRVKQNFEGLTFTPLTIMKGVRIGTRELIRETMRVRPDYLTVKPHALVTRILLDAERRATGVEFLDAAHLYRADPAARLDGPVTAPRRTVRARREVILAGGTFNTPQLLMLSGIGPPAELEKHHIKVEVALCGVGRNLQDRYEIGVVHNMQRDFEILRNATFTPDDAEFKEWRNGQGLYATNGAVAAIVKRSSYGQPAPDLYLFAIPGYFAGYRPSYSQRARTHKNHFTWVILKAHTNNTAGRVQLNSCDPRDPPAIDFCYFDDGNDVRGDDLDSVVAGVEFVRKLSRGSAGVLVEQIPGPQIQSRAQIAQFVKSIAAFGSGGPRACASSTPRCFRRFPDFSF
jgi:choline dehydrogenase